MGEQRPWSDEGIEGEDFDCQTRGRIARRHQLVKS